MARQCMVAAIRHQIGGEPSASMAKGLSQSRMLELSLGAAAKGAKCEQLEKIVIGNDEEKFFQVGA